MSRQRPGHVHAQDPDHGGRGDRDAGGDGREPAQRTVAPGLRVPPPLRRGRLSYVSHTMRVRKKPDIEMTGEASQAKDRLRVSSAGAAVLVFRPGVRRQDTSMRAPPSSATPMFHSP